MKTDLKQPCVECPFRKKHLPGWLGPWTTPGEIVRHIHGDGLFPCHRTIKDKNPEAEMQVCAGASIHMNRAIKRSRNADHARHQAKLKDAPPEVVDSVFNWPQEFIDHHEQDIGEWMKKKEQEK